MILNVAENIKEASDAYEKAHEKSKNLPSTNPIRLGLVLNYSVFCFEIKNEPKDACSKAKEVSCSH